MADSYQKIIDDLRETKYGTFDINSWNNFANRLEALRAQPVAWMDKDGIPIKHMPNLELEIFIIPLIRAD